MKHRYALQFDNRAEYSTGSTSVLKWCRQTFGPPSYGKWGFDASFGRKMIEISFEDDTDYATFLLFHG